ncbi:KGK domain-containing protein [Merismopedia glauca]|uniref:KGK family protein n=1 Tax=Merismopedia glauca CCAP 1448/3 TaxID=1296344 RepID=A0A2T1C914_9CYAN|nr:KGK domain-containing protein [Merismopedia glauca]PSB04739.1 hypothetical protein C7B64_02660 [Merismopedia glauca CCAP 1448/3]
MKPKFEPLNCRKDDVVCMDGCTSMIGQIDNVFNFTFSTDLREKIADQIIEKHLVLTKGGAYNLLSDYGTSCQILRVGSPDWVKGKIRVKLQLEFVPDEPEIKEVRTTNTHESPLDDLRRAITETN